MADHDKDTFLRAQGRLRTVRSIFHAQKAKPKQLEPKYGNDDEITSLLYATCLGALLV